MRTMSIRNAAALIGLISTSLYAAPAFHRDVQPILQRHCQGCHHQGDIGPMSLMTYAEARPWAKATREAVLQKKMPPWFADSGDTEYANNPSLSKAEIETLAAWAESGAAAGDPEDAP